MEQHFAVGTGLEVIALGLQFSAQLPVVVNLTVANQPECLIDIGQGLMATGQINDRQPSHGNSAGAIDMHTLVIRPPMSGNVPHCRQHVGGDRLPIKPINSVNTAHDETSGLKE